MDKKIKESVGNEPDAQFHDLKDGLPVSDRVEKVVEDILKLTFIEIASMSMYSSSLL